MTQTYTAEDLRPIPQRPETGIPLLRAIWEQIKSDSSAWRQGVWIGESARVSQGAEELAQAVKEYLEENEAPPWNCGTAYCLAGHTVLAKGAKIPNYSLHALNEGYGFDASFVIEPVQGRRREVDTWAAELLGLEHDQAHALFYGENWPWAIEQMISALERDPATDASTLRQYLYQQQDALRTRRYADYYSDSDLSQESREQLDLHEQIVAWETENGFYENGERTYIR
jgi:hypothetical protein